MINSVGTSAILLEIRRGENLRFWDLRLGRVLFPINIMSSLNWPCSRDLSIYNLQNMMKKWSERFEKKLLGISAPLSSHHKIYLCAQFSMYVDNLNVVLQ